MSLPMDTPPGVANTLGYLQHHLQELTEWQNASEHAINTTLMALTAQIQQITQLMTNPAPTPTIAPPLIPVSPPPVRPPSPAPAASSKQWARPKLLSPPDFSGEQSSEQAFLNSCTLYLHLAPEQFTCNEKKIFWTLTFFKNRCAAKWSKNLFHQEVDTGIFPIWSWTDFEQQFQSQFFLVNAEVDTINTLEGSSYYQGNWMVDDYLDSFLILASGAGYMNPGPW